MHINMHVIVSRKKNHIRTVGVFQTDNFMKVRRSFELSMSEIGIRFYAMNISRAIFISTKIKFWTTQSINSIDQRNFFGGINWKAFIKIE